MNEPPKFTELRALAAKGLFVTGVAQAWRVAIGFMSSIVLARLLTPTDFGLFAAVSTCLAFVGLFQDLGLNQATIQRPMISEGQMSGLFWISTAVGVALAAAMAAIAPAAAWFFGDTRIESLVIACSALLVLGAIQSQHVALLNRGLRYKALAAIDVLSASLSAIVGVVVAWLTSSYWALFAASFSSLLFSGISAWSFSRWIPGRPGFDGHFSEIFRFGAGVSGFNVVNYFSRNADNLLIGRYYGPDQLGLYDRAYRLLLFPLHQVMLPLGRMIFPLLCRLQSDPQRYRKAYFESVSLLMMAAQPGLVFAIVFSEEVFLLLFGAHWVPAAKIFSWLGVAGIFHMANVPIGWLYLSQGRSSEFFKAGLICTIATVASFVIGLPWGAIGVAIAYTLAEYLVRLPVTWISVGRKGPVSSRDLVTMSFPHVVATITTACVLWASSHALERPQLVGCFSLATASYIVYLLTLLAFATKRELLTRHAQSIWKLVV